MWHCQEHAVFCLHLCVTWRDEYHSPQGWFTPWLNPHNCPYGASAKALHTNFYSQYSSCLFFFFHFLFLTFPFISCPTLIQAQHHPCPDHTQQHLSICTGFCIFYHNNYVFITTLTSTRVCGCASTKHHWKQAQSLLTSTGYCSLSLW